MKICLKLDFDYGTIEIVDVTNTGNEEKCLEKAIEWLQVLFILYNEIVSYGKGEWEKMKKERKIEYKKKAYHLMQKATNK